MFSESKILGESSAPNFGENYEEWFWNDPLLLGTTCSTNRLDCVDPGEVLVGFIFKRKES